MNKLAFVLVIAAGCKATGEAVPEGPRMNKQTPVLVVDEIEPCLALWVDRLGFEKTAEVPGGDGLVFVSLERDGVEVMYQTRAGLQDAISTVANGPYRTMLFVEVESIDDVESRLEGLDVLIPRHDTFYGSIEVCVRDPGGHLITFAQMLPPAEDE